MYREPWIPDWQKSIQQVRVRETVSLSHSLIHALSLTHSLSRWHPLPVTHSPSLNHSLTHTLPITHTLSHSHTLSHTLTLTLKHTHSLTHSHTNTLLLSHSLTHTLTHSPTLSLSLSHSPHSHSLPPRIHFNFLWQLQRCPIVVEMLKAKPTDPVNVTDTNTHIGTDTDLIAMPPPYYSDNPDLDPGSDTGINSNNNNNQNINTLSTSTNRLSIRSPPSTNTYSTNSTLAQLSVTCLRFNVEVLARARASGCVHAVRLCLYFVISFYFILFYLSYCWVPPYFFNIFLWFDIVLLHYIHIHYSFCKFYSFNSHFLSFYFI